MSYTTLTGHITENFPGGLSVVGINRSFTVADGTVFEIAVPFLPIGNDLVITPKADLGEDKVLRLDLTRWCPGIVCRQVVAVLAVDFSTQALAVRCARDFHADRTTSWSDSWPQVLVWLRPWASANGVAGLDDPATTTPATTPAS